jgi:NAD+ diphosphatase
MIGAIADSAGAELVIDRTELDEARWFSRDAVKAALRGDENAGFLPPPRFAIARTLLDHWVASSAP